ncbi:MAG: ZIP family metal transporter [Elusimicrobiota bacterium]|nr:ZIP family metal transporter [Elusimicrobiota bacterium]
MLPILLVLALLATAAGGALPAAGAFVRGVGLPSLLAFRSGLLIAIAFTDVLPGGLRLGAAQAGWSALFAFALGYASENLVMSDPCHEAAEGCRSHALGSVALGALFLHSFIDGLNLGALTFVSASALAAAGMSMLVHKFADGFTLASLFTEAGYGRERTVIGLTLVALATPAGALVSRFGALRLEPSQMAMLLGFAGGSFVYIAAAELLPRLHRGRDARSFASFGAGLAAMLALHFALG